MKSLLMNKIIITFLILFTFLNIHFSASAADVGSGFSIGTKTYLAYETMLDGDNGLTDGAFSINRSYLTVKKSVNDYLSFRITLDSYMDGGNMNARLKYVYADFNLGDIAFFNDANIEFGIVHMPWLDFEEHINYYRMQGTMFMERNHLFNSADFGITAGALLGGKVSEEYQKTVNSKYPGKYGSLAFGVYNGSGYHAAEANDNKTVEGRLTIRPLPEVIPGFQVSYFGVFGNTNLSADTISDGKVPNWMTNAVMLSYEHQYFTLTGQYVSGEGNQKGSLVMPDAEGYEASKINGFSVFAEGKLGEHWRVIGRYDSFDPNTDADDNEVQRLILGAGYDFGNHNILILDFDKAMHSNSEIDDVDKLKLTMQVHF